MERNAVIGMLRDESDAERKTRERRANQRAGDLKTIAYGLYSAAFFIDISSLRVMVLVDAHAFSNRWKVWRPQYRRLNR